MNKITNDDIILSEIVEELKDIKKKYGKPRNCRIIDKSELNNIPRGEFKVIISVLYNKCKYKEIISSLFK